MEAGNRCFDQRVPEEVNRKIVDHLSDINMPLSEHARQYLINEGIKPETIIKTGSPMLEVLNANMEKILQSDILVKEDLKAGEYILMSIHREENVDSKQNFDDLLETIEEITNVYKKHVIISTHPRTRKKAGRDRLPAYQQTDQVFKTLWFSRIQSSSIESFLCDIG
eukprot:Opistho-1_new@102952